jgi:uridine kinase
MRLLITGASGSGTTTLGKAVADLLGWTHLDTDDYYWLPTQPPYTCSREPVERLRLIGERLETTENAVVSGSVMGWDDELEDSFDLIVFLYLDTAIRIERLRAREERELGAADPEFLEWAAGYDTGPPYGRSLAKHTAWLSKRSCPVLRLEGDLTVDERCTRVLASLPTPA